MRRDWRKGSGSAPGATVSSARRLCASWGRRGAGERVNGLRPGALRGDAFGEGGLRPGALRGDAFGEGGLRPGALRGAGAGCAGR
ncbi:MAG: hypothetical protein K0R38_2869 [Polyangiaceae bacterium]|jgi:hypothetical protein|nr:hypothetical protein [Polyangiaceae bacterium]